MLFVSILLKVSILGAKTLDYNVHQLNYLDIDSAITPATLEYLQTNLKQIPQKGLIVIRLNTPGGLVTTTKEIISALNGHDAPKVIWVTPSGASAASAGAIISSAADFIVMTPGTTIGAATPVGINDDIKESDGKNKVLNDLVALIEGLSELRKRDAAPFRDMIRTAKSFSNVEAQKKGISIGDAQTTQELIDLLQGKIFHRKDSSYQLSFSPNLDYKQHEQTLGQEILSLLAQPQLAYILFLVGAALIYFELQAPGGFIAGSLGAISLLIAAISFQVLPLNWGALLLVILGLILFVLEIYITSYGLLTIGAIAALTLGSLFLFQPENALIVPPMNIILSTLASVIVVMVGFSLFLFKTRRKGKENFFSPLHKEGVVIDVTSQFIQVKVEGQIWRAISKDTLLINDLITVTHVDNEKLQLTIEKISRS